MLVCCELPAAQYGVELAGTPPGSTASTETILYAIGSQTMEAVGASMLNASAPRTRMGLQVRSFSGAQACWPETGQSFMAAISTRNRRMQFEVLPWPHNASTVTMELVSTTMSPTGDVVCGTRVPTGEGKSFGHGVS